MYCSETPHQTQPKYVKVKIVKYLAVGGFQFVLDFLLFLLLQKMGIFLVVANVISRLSAATAGYYLNRKYTFSVRQSHGYSMVFRYWSFWIFMTILSSILILTWTTLLGDRYSAGFGKFIVESVLCVLGFFVSKMWVYRHAQE